MNPRQQTGAASARAPSIGPVRRFGRYTLVKKLATGGMAEIWLARQRGLAGFNRFVVIKKILSHLSEQETFVKMFLDEARTSAQLNHPNVVQIYDLGREGDSYFIAMEFIAGENLAAIAWRGMKRGKPFSPTYAARVIADTCKALHYAHHLRGSDGRPLEIVHRDISPQNILVTYEGEVKVVDFGIAKAKTKSEHTKTGMLKGKFSYMSPEQCLGAPVDMRSDVFALGILLYELCTGKRLFKHESELMILEMITKRSVVPPSQVAPGISPGLEDVIIRALEKSTDSRYQTAQEMQIALEEYLRDDGAAASNADIAGYMRELFNDKIEEKRKLREIASRDDFESSFGDEEETEQALPPRPGSSTHQPPNQRRIVHGLPPSQINSMPGSMPPGMPQTGTMNHPMAAQGSQGMVGPMGTGAGPYPPGSFQPGQYGSGLVSYPGQGTISGEGSSWVARIVIAGALVVILVASAILYQQLNQQPETVPQTVVNTTPQPPPPPRKTGSITLESVPQGATIILDGKPMELGNGELAKTPSDLHSLQYGTTYSIELKKDGYKPFKDKIVMGKERDGKPIRPTLEAFPGTIIVDVRGSRARDTRIFFNEADIGLGPRISKQWPGNQTVRIKAELGGMRCVANPARVRVEPNRTDRVSVSCSKHIPTRVAKTTRRPSPTPPTPRKRPTGGCVTDTSLPSGYVTISTKPYSTIYWGNRKLGETPLSKYKLPSGCVKLRAVNKNLNKTKTVQVTIEPNKVSIFQFTL